MKEEVVIIQGEPKNVYKNGKNPKNGFTDWVTKQWDNPTGILGEPQYAVIHVKGTGIIGVLMEIDFKKSKLQKGLIVPESDPVAISIPVRYGNDKLEGLRYTTFRKLLTHKTTDEL
jgi:hypothetical protein